MNLYEETTKALADHNKTWDDVSYIVSILGDDPVEYAIPVDFFIMAAKTIYYDDGHGGQEINPYLSIVGDTWWLERGEYNGSEWWEFKTRPRWVVHTAATKAEMMRLIRGEDYGEVC